MTRIINLKKCLGFLFLILLIGGSASASGSKNRVGPATPANSPYLLKPGDVIQIRFFFNPELNDEILIRPDGRISMQLVGDVEVAGSSVEQAVATLKDRYAEHLTTPEITVQVRLFGSQKIYVTGEVVRPGLVPMPGQLTVLEAIAESGGILKSGKGSEVILIRKGPDGLPVISELKIWDDDQPTSQAATLLNPYDVLVVPERGISKAGRWVDDHIRKMIPVNLTFGFQYLWTSGTEIVPF